MLWGRGRRSGPHVRAFVAPLAPPRRDRHHGRGERRVPLAGGWGTAVAAALAPSGGDALLLSPGATIRVEASRVDPGRGGSPAACLVASSCGGVGARREGC